MKSITQIIDGHPCTTNIIDDPITALTTYHGLVAGSVNEEDLNRCLGIINDVVGDLPVYQSELLKHIIKQILQERKQGGINNDRNKFNRH